MRLLQRTNRAYMLSTALLLLIVGGALYMIITRVIIDEVTEKLTVDRERVVRVLEEGLPVHDLPPVIVIDTLPTDAVEEPVTVSDVELFDPVEEDVEPFREVSGSRHINGVHYRITTRAVVLEPHDYLYSIGLALLIGSLLVLGGLWWVNRRLSRTVWGAFHHNLEALQRFDLRTDQALALEPSAITEFNELNGELTRLTERIHADHRALKEFTGNASHEMQTPLAALQARLEEVLGRRDLDERTATTLSEAHAQCLRLSRLHQALLLLSRIENRQFRETSTINVVKAVERELQRHEDIIEAKGIVVDHGSGTSLNVEAHPVLLETLLANVIGNAIKHQRGNGAVRVMLRERELVISNPGESLPHRADLLFERFRKADRTSSSPGLGLSIARSICTASGWRIDYNEHNGIHTVTIRF